MLQEIYNTIFELINPICPTYADTYPPQEEKQYPYCTITFPTISENNEYSDNNMLQIDIWNNESGNIINIEKIVDSIYKALYKQIINDKDKLLIINKATPWRLVFTDPDPLIQRRQLKFIVKSYFND